MASLMRLTLEIWRQGNANQHGTFQSYQMTDISPNMSFLEMLDQLNEQLVQKGESPVAFDSDCREGICGSCGLFINGRAHGPGRAIATCQLHMRSFQDGDRITIEPFRAGAFPLIRDLVVDRTSLDRIMQAGGYISVNTGSAPEAHTILVPKKDSDGAFDAAACIGCGACVATCKNASAYLFLGAKIWHLAQLPQGKIERGSRVQKMLEAHDAQGFGHCSNTGACEVECPKGISLRAIAKLNREWLQSKVCG